MITGPLKSQVDQLWNKFASGGIANPLTTIEQITYLLFTRRLDEVHTTREKKANLLGKPLDKPIFSADQQKLRWSRFKDLEAETMFKLYRDDVFTFIKQINANGDSAYTRFMKDAVFVIPTPALFQQVVTLIDAIPMQDRDTKGDLYEYLLSKIASAGRNGQFRTPRHIIKMMVEMLAPQPTDVIGDPACGTCGFLVAAGEYFHEKFPELFHDQKFLKHFSGGMFHGSDFDATMCRIGAMNLMLHGIENPDIQGPGSESGGDSLSQDASGIRDRYTVILANPPFKGSLNEDEVAKDLLQSTKTKKTELLFLALFLEQLKIGGRCACIVPDGVLFGSSNAHRQIRETIIDGHKLEGIVSMPSGVFKPYAGVSTAVMIFTRTDSGGTDQVWFYDMTADGLSLDDKRDEIEANDIPDILAKWQAREPQAENDRKAKSFLVPVEDIRDNKYDLSINRYKESAYAEVKYENPLVILDQLEALEKEIVGDLQVLRGMLG